MGTSVVPSQQSGGKQQARKPFRQGTRQRITPVGTIPFAVSTQATPLPMPKIGYLSAILLRLSGTMTLSSGGTLTDDGAVALFKRIQVYLNQGSQLLFDCTGAGALAMQRWERFGFEPHKAGIGDTTPSADVWSTPVASGANQWDMFLRIPIALNDGRDFDVGLIGLQAPEVQCSLNIQWGAGADVVNNFTSFAGSLYVAYEAYDVPDQQKYDNPPLVIVRTIEEDVPFGNTGDVVYTVPPMGILVQDTSFCRINALRSDAFDNVRIRFNKNDTVYQMDRQFIKATNRMIYGLNSGTGMSRFDFFNAWEQVSAGDDRDSIDTEELATLEIIHTITSGTSLGTNNNKITHVRRIVQPVGGA